MVHAWAVDQRMLLGQIATDGKFNEITTVLKLLAMLSLKGCLVTADAMSCQRAICTQIVEQGGDYVISLKGNQGTMHDDVRLFLEDPAPPVEVSHTTVDAGHGPIATRIGEVSTDIGWLQKQHAWPNLAAVGKLVRTREVMLLSRPLSAARFTEVAHAQWGIENGLHWVLDVTMNEDCKRNCKDHGPENIGLLRRLTLNLARLEGSKGSVTGKLKQAGWNDQFLERLFGPFAKCHMR